MRRTDRIPEDGETLHDAVRVLVAGIVHAFTLGNILCFGVFVPNLRFTLLPRDYDVYLIGEGLFICMLLAGSLLDPMHALLDSERCGWMPRPVRDRVINVIGALLWIGGFTASIFYTSDYSGFAWVVAALGGLGSGLLFWNIWIMLPSWVPLTSRAFPLATLWLLICPPLYVLCISHSIIGLESIRESHLKGPSLWAWAYTIFTPMWGLFLLMAAFMLATSSDHEQEAALRDRKRDNEAAPLPRTLPHPGGGTFALFLVSCGLFQAVYYLPYVFMPTFVTLDPMFGSKVQSSGVLYLLATGVLLGKAMAAFAFAFAGGGEGIGGASSLKFAFKVLWVFATGYMITACTWISVYEVPSAYAVAFFLGLFGGGVGLSTHVSLYLTEPTLVIGYTTSALVSVYAFVLAVGQSLATLTVHYAAGGAGYVYATAAFACAFWVAIVALPTLVPSAKRFG